MKNPFKTTAPKASGRNRPVSGRSAAPSAFSYYSQRSDRTESMTRQQGRTEAKPRPSFDFLLKRTGFVIGGILILICTISILSLTPSPRIIMLGSASNRYYLHPEMTYQQAATAAFKHSIFNRNKITVNTGQVAAALQKQFPELSSVSITLPLVGQRPIVYLQPSQPVFILAAANGSYVLGDSGKVLLSAARVPADSKLNLPVITDKAVTSVQQGQNAITTGDTAFIETVLAELAARHVVVGSMALPAAADELDVAIQGRPYYVKFNLHDSASARQQAGTFLAVQAKLKSENVTPKQYIDVRVLARAYYK